MRVLRNSQKKITGAFTYEYAAISNPHVFMMVPECCTFYDERCWDNGPSDTTLADAVKHSAETTSEANKFLSALYGKVERFLKHPSPLLDMIREVVKEIRFPTVQILDPRRVDWLTLPDRPATVAQKVQMGGRADVYRMFYLGE